MTWLAAFVFSVGICFFWPTMLGFVAEYLPKTGALGLSLMGGAGMFSVSLILPVMGGWLEGYKKTALAQGMDEATATAYASSETLMKVAVMPAIVLVVFVIIYVVKRKHYIQHAKDMAQAEARATA